MSIDVNPLLSQREHHGAELTRVFTDWMYS